MKRNTFFDFIVKNKYVILCVAIVLVLLLTGILKFVIEAAVVVFVFMLAIYVGKRIQEDNDYIKKAFDLGKQKIKYTVKDNDDDKDQE